MLLNDNTDMSSGSVSRLNDIMQSLKGMIDSVEARRLVSNYEMICCKITKVCAVH